MAVIWGRNNSLARSVKRRMVNYFGGYSADQDISLEGRHLTSVGLRIQMEVDFCWKSLDLLAKLIVLLAMLSILGCILDAYCVLSGHMTKFDDSLMNREQVIDLEIRFKAPLNVSNFEKAYP